jgi:hypothetical protein
MDNVQKVNDCTNIPSPKLVDLNMFASSLSLGNLNAQPRVFKCQGTTVFTNQQNPETLYL